MILRFPATRERHTSRSPLRKFRGTMETALGHWEPEGGRRPMRSFVSKAARTLAASLAVAVLLYVAFRVGRWGGSPAEVSALRDNREDFTRCAERVLRGEGIQQDGAEGERLLNALQRAGVKGVRQEGGCVFFTFWFMPTDSIPELIYSPTGYGGLPTMAVNPAGGPSHRHLTHFEYIDQEWFYWAWDVE
jgi:hypothetical protein